MLDTVQSRCFFLAPERPQLYPRIDRRFDAMMATGARGSVGAPCARARSGLAGDARPRVPRLIAYLERRLSLKEAIARGKLDTRHYVKRRFTFARHQLRGFHWLAPRKPSRRNPRFRSLPPRAGGSQSFLLSVFSSANRFLLRRKAL